MSLETLQHSEKKLPHGGLVLVLDTGAAINPEAEAMIQALHSRSTGGVHEHLQTLITKGAEKFMASYYVGYGHKSIGDCGTITIFIEGVSMLAAKAIQDWPLYSGQESSTRYIDFSKQRFINLAGTATANDILETWRSFYLKGLDPVKQHLKEQFPIAEGEKEAIYEKAINARAFDIMRGYLPAGASTNLAWHTNLRQAADKIMLLRHHPLSEVQDIAKALLEALEEAFPSSFIAKRYEATEQYNAFWTKQYTYLDTTTHHGDSVDVLHDNIDTQLLEQSREVLEKRPPKTELPKYLAECGTMQLGFMLDFGSFRDVQRHRAVTQRMPLLTDAHGFEQFYIDSLPKVMHDDAQELLTKQKEKLAALNLSPEDQQYYTAMGYNLPNRMTGDIASLVYLVELRATRFVHPTLQKRASQIGQILQEKFGKFGLTLHLDDDPGRFDSKRGEHDIVAK